jgi:hypothetical protein
VKLAQNAFLGQEVIATLVTEAEVKARYPEFDLARRPLAQTGDGKLVVAWRRTRASDWVNGKFVGMHECPEDELHVHGEP